LEAPRRHGLEQCLSTSRSPGGYDPSLSSTDIKHCSPAGGSGLIGLRDRVQALGGSIEVTSHPGDGTAIVVELPLQPD
jgi:signal transduction histidine kinase